MRISNRPVFHTPDRPGRGDRDSREIYNPDCEYRAGIAEESRQGDEETGGTGAGGEVEGRYHQLYEQRMNPFDQVGRYIATTTITVLIGYIYCNLYCT